MSQGLKGIEEKIDNSQVSLRRENSGARPVAMECGAAPYNVHKHIIDALISPVFQA